MYEYFARLFGTFFSVRIKNSTYILIYIIIEVSQFHIHGHDYGHGHVAVMQDVTIVLSYNWRIFKMFKIYMSINLLRLN